MVEYADLQCSYCAQWATNTFPVLLREYVRPGHVKIVFRGLSFVGPDSKEALRTAVAAGRQRNELDSLGPADFRTELDEFLRSKRAEPAVRPAPPDRRLAR